MIQLSSTSILILYDDSTTEPLESGMIRNRIVRACVSAGETESWIAGDLALAVEFSLLNSEKRMIRAGELDAMICAVLEDAGYPAVAAEYQRISKAAPPDYLPADAHSVQLVLEQNLSLEPERMNRIVSRVQKALELLGMDQVSRGLILELARQFRDMDFTASVVPQPEENVPQRPASVILRKEELEEFCGETASRFLRSRVLQVSHISRLFSVLRIELSLTAFSELNGLEKPVTELLFWSAASPLIAAIDDLCRTADDYALERGESDSVPLPLSLTVRDAVSFAQNYMNSPEKNAEDCIRGLMGTLVASLERQPFKVELK